MDYIPCQYHPEGHSKLFFENFFQYASILPVRVYTEHILAFVYSGELIIRERDIKVVIRKGEYIFIRRNPETLLQKSHWQGEQFLGILMGFNECFLKEFYQKENIQTLSHSTERFRGNIVRLPYTPYLESLYISLRPYLTGRNKPFKQLLEIKLQEGIRSLLLTDQKFHTCLFDFIKVN